MVSKKNKGNDPEELNAAFEDFKRKASAENIDTRVSRGSSEALPTLPRNESAYLAGRRAMAYELLQSGGLSSGRLGLEVLYLLPDWFVEFYAEVFHRALKVDDGSVMHGRSGGLEKAKGQSGGMVLGSENRLQAGGSGKKFKNPVMSVGSEKWFRIKEQLDQTLEQAVQDTRKQLRVSGQGLGQGLRAQCSGNLPGPGNKRCRRFLKESWAFCPSCGKRVESGDTEFKGDRD